MMLHWLRRTSRVPSAYRASQPCQKAALRRRTILNLERLEDREVPSTSINSTPTSIVIMVPGGETAILNISGGSYTITDPAGVTGTGGTVAVNTFTANDPASGQTNLGVNLGTAGTVQFGAANVIPTTTTVNLGGGVFDLNGHAEAFGVLNGAGNITNSQSSTTAVLTLGSNNGHGSFSGAINDATPGGMVALAITGTGTVTLSGTNNYSGGTTISSGILNINSDGALGGAAGAVNLNGGTLQFAAGSSVTLNNSRNIVLGGGAFDTNGNNATINGVISGSSPTNSNFIMNGTGLLTLTNANTYVGSTTVNAGTLSVSNTSNLGSGALIVNNASTTGSGTQAELILSNSTQTVGPLSGTITNQASGNTASILLGPATTLTVNQTAAGTFQGNIVGGGSLVLSDTSNSTLQLSGNSTYTGSTTINGGVVQLHVTNALPATTPLTLSAGTFNLNNNNQTVASLAGAGAIGTGTGTGGILTVNNTSVPTTFSGIISGAGGITLSPSNTKTLMLTGANTYTGPTTISGGTLQMGANGVLSNGTTATAVTLANTAGATFDLNNFNATVGPIQGGGTGGGNILLGLGNGGAGSGGTLTVVVSSTSTYAGNITGNGNLILNGAGAGSNTGTLFLTGINTYTGSTTVNAGVLNFNSAAAIAGTGANLTVSSGAALAAGFAINQAFLSRITSGSSGTIALGANSSNNLDFSAATGANLTAAALGAVGTVIYSGTLTPNGNTYRLGGGGGNLTVSSNLVNGQTADSLIVGFNGTSAGVVNLTGTNTYTGTTSVNGGRLNVDGKLLNGGAVTVAAGATLGGAGTVDAPVTVNIGGVISAGDSPTSPGILAVDLGINGTLSAYLNGTNAGMGFGQLQAFGGMVNLASFSTLSLGVGPNFTGTPPAAGTLFDILVNGPGMPLTPFAGMPEGSDITDGTGNYEFSISYLGGASGADVVLDYLGTTVTAISPTSGLAAGGASVTITGTNFNNVTAVDFGGTAAMSYIVNSPTQITAFSPMGTAGSVVDVTVTTLGGTSAINPADEFTYLPAAPPSVISFTVNGSGTAVGAAAATENNTGTTATITASGLALLGFYPGELVNVTGFAVQTSFNGTYAITSTSGNTFSYADSLPVNVTDSGGTANPVVEKTNAGVSQVNERSMVSSLVVVFNQEVTIASPSTAFTLAQKAFTANGTPNSMAGDVSTVVTATNPSGDMTTWVLQFSGGMPATAVTGGSISDGDYYLNLAAGSVAVTASPSTVNASYQNSFYRLFGDVAGSGVVANPALTKLKLAFGSLAFTDPGYNAAFDYFGSGVETNPVLTKFKQRFGTVWMGL